MASGIAGDVEFQPMSQSAANEPMIILPLVGEILEVSEWAGIPGNNNSGYIGGTKNDEDKPDMSLLPRGPLEREARVLMHGARKYGRNNWRAGFDHTRLLAAALRHLIAYSNGEDNDPETGLCHLDHASCMVHFLSELRITHPELDDRGFVSGDEMKFRYTVDMMGNPTNGGPHDSY